MKFGNHSKIAFSWLIFATFGISGFFVAKEYTNNNKLNAMKVRADIRRRLEEENTRSDH